MTVRLSALLDQPTRRVWSKSIARFVQEESGNTLHLVVVLNGAGVPLRMHLRPEGTAEVLMEATAARLAALTYVDHKDVSLMAIVELARHLLQSGEVLKLGEVPNITSGVVLQRYYTLVTGDKADEEAFRLLYAACMHAVRSLTLLTAVCSPDAIVELNTAVTATAGDGPVEHFDELIEQWGGTEPGTFDATRMDAREQIVAILIFAAVIHKVDF